MYFIFIFILIYFLINVSFPLNSYIYFVVHKITLLICNDYRNIFFNRVSIQWEKNNIHTQCPFDPSQKGDMEETSKVNQIHLLSKVNNRVTLTNYN